MHVCTCTFNKDTGITRRFVFTFSCFFSLATGVLSLRYFPCFLDLLSDKTEELSETSSITSSTTTFLDLARTTAGRVHLGRLKEMEEFCDEKLLLVTMGECEGVTWEACDNCGTKKSIIHVNMLCEYTTQMQLSYQ